MKPERWQKIDEIFHAALQYKPDERKAFIEKPAGVTRNCDGNSSPCWSRSKGRTSLLSNPRWNSWQRT